MSARRILLYSPGWPPAEYPNGIVAYVASLREALAWHGWSGRVLAGDRPGVDDAVFWVKALVPGPGLAHRFWDRVVDRVVPGGATSSRWGRSITEALRKVREVFDYDVVEVEETWGFAEHVRRSFPDVPVVLRLHGPWFLNGRAAGATEDVLFHRRLRAERRAIECAEFVSAPSRDVLQRTREFYGLPLERAVVVPNPGPDVPPQLRWRPERCRRDVILFVGRFDRHKGGDLVIDAFAELATRVPDARLWFVGPDYGHVADDGRRWGLQEYIEAHVADAEVRQRIEVLGRKTHDEIALLRSQAAVTVVSSRYENFSIAALEAVAFGSPLVASDAGGLVEIVRPGETGLQFRSGDSRDLARKVETLLRDPDLATRLAGNALRDFAERFAPDVVAERMARFYEGVVTSRVR